MGLEPTTLSLGSATPSRPTVHTQNETVAISQGYKTEPVQPSQRIAAFAKDFIPYISQRLRVIEGGAKNLLTVRQAAERLGVSTATVYGLCERGELAHVRVSNAIRITREDLVQFIDAQKKGRRR